MAPPPDCPCCSGAAYAVCCRPLHHDGVAAPNAEALMRSRYAAFALKQTNYLYATLHSSHPDRQGPRAPVIGQLKKTCNRFTYPALHILNVEPPDAEGNAFVTFRAVLLDHGTDVGFVERSRFVQEDGAWRYVQAMPLPPS